jgi:hypothetical protein
MSDKPLSYVSQISELKPIPNKDRIVLAKFSNNDWSVIVSKADFQVGDYCIYIETGSILPIKPEFQFLEKRCFSPKYKGYKIKTIKMGEAYSEGIAFSFAQLKLPVDSEIDKDYTELLEIRRAEDEVPSIMIQVKKSSWQRFIEKWVYRIFKIKMMHRGFGLFDFPSDIIPKTDETQVQSLKYVFDALKGQPIYATIKIDGQSATYVLNDGMFTISSRNRTIYKANIKKAIKEINQKKMHKTMASSHAYCAAKYDLPLRMQLICQEMGTKNLALQGEVAGPGIQKNRLGLEEWDLFIFSAYHPDVRKFYTLPTLQYIVTHAKLRMVPLISNVTTFNWADIDKLTNWTENLMYGNGTPAEGVVIRANPSELYMPPAMHKMNAMCSLKCINPLFKIATQDE